jgi:uroporphyrinogen decarboxylase
MTSRERINAALQHKATDVLPIDFGGHRSSGISAIAYNKLKEKLNLDKQTTKLYDLMQQLAVIEDEVLNEFGADVVQVHRLSPSFGIKNKEWKPGLLPDNSPCLVPKDFNPLYNKKGFYEIIDPVSGLPLGRRPEDGLYYDSARYYLSEVETIEELEQIMELPDITEEELDYLEEQAKQLYFTTDKALLVHLGGSIFEQGQQEFGFENFYCHLAINQDLIHYWADRIANAHIRVIDKILSRIGSYVSIGIFGGDDMGTQINLQISLPMYQEMIKPYQSRMYRFVRDKYPTVAVGLHCCGAIFDLIPDLIDAGVQVLNPVQISAQGMDPKRLKQEYGKDIVFWGGGADMQQFVKHTDSLDLIYKHTRQLIDIFYQDSGFVFSQVHNILSDVPPEKIITIYKAALDSRKG